MSIARFMRKPLRHALVIFSLICVSDIAFAKADEADCDYRTAAYTIAISRVAEASRLKGLFP